MTKAKGKKYHESESRNPFPLDGNQWLRATIKSFHVAVSNGFRTPSIKEKKPRLSDGEMVPVHTSKTQWLLIHKIVLRRKKTVFVVDDRNSPNKQSINHTAQSSVGVLVAKQACFG